MKEIYSVLATAMGQETRLAQIANNLANVDTVGFKQDRAVFQDFLKAAALANGTQPDPNAPAVAVYGAGYTDFTAGPAIQTGATFDLLIEGDGFFQIEGPGGATFYSRAGNFRLDAESNLVNVDGRRVLDEAGAAINLADIAGKPTIGPDGTITVDGDDLATIGLVTFLDRSVLEKYGESLFRAPAGTIPAADEASTLRQGFVEGSNTNPIEEMVRMVETQRAFEIQQQAMRSFDQITEAKISQILNG